MNVLFINPQFPLPTSGGVEHVTLLLQKHFLQHGIDAWGVTDDALPAVADSLPDVLKSRWQTLPDPTAILCQRNVDFLSALCRSCHIDIIIKQGFPKPRLLDLAAAIPDHPPIVTTCHTSPFHMRTFHEIMAKRLYGNRPFSACLTALRFPFEPLRKWLWLRKERTVCRHAYDNSQAVVLLSQQFQEEFIRLAALKDASRLFAIPNPLEAVSLDGQSLLLPRKKQLLWVGRMEFSPKQPDRMLRIWQTLAPLHPDWTLVMAGDGAARKPLESFCRRKHLPRVSFVGQTDCTGLYRQSEFLCMTSTKEGFGLVLLEALQNGCIPIAFDSFRSVHDIIREGVNGYTIPPFNNTLFADRLHELMTDDARRLSLRQSHDITFPSFEPSAVVSLWNGLFDRLSGHC